MVEAVAGQLLPVRMEGPVDLSDTLVVVPTRQAGRRLREHLAAVCANQDSALLAARVVLPHFFFQPAQDTQRTLLRSAWAEWLLEADLARYPGFFPHPPERDFSWALHTGDQVQRLRDTLNEGGLRLADVPVLAAEEIEVEQERWESLVALEQDFSAYLQQRHIVDPCTARREAAMEAPQPERIERIVLAAVPDPAPLAITALERWTGTLRIDILVHAPGDSAGCFDAWGRPDPENGPDTEWPLPDPECTLRLTGAPPDQARAVLQVIAEEQDRFGPGDIAVGVPDREVIPPLQDALAAMHLQAFDPAERPLHEHALYHLLTDYLDWIRHGRCADLARLLRQPDLLRLLHEQDALAADQVLAEWDALHNRFLPGYREDLERLFRDGCFTGPDRSGSYTALAPALDRIFRLPDPAGTGSVEKAVRAFLQQVYGERTLRDDHPDDADLAAAAGTIAALCDEFADPAMHFLEQDDALHLFQRRLEECDFPRERSEARIDLEGWLELHWNDAPLLVVTGFNEGLVPDGRVSDSYLPDRLRHRLALRSDAQRRARDAYLLAAMAASRRRQGRLVLILGKVNGLGDPLKPSRLLFACPDAELPARAAQLFAPRAVDRPTAPHAVSFRLDVCPPPDLPTEDLVPPRLPVTALRGYLACPFRFYLDRILGLHTDDDRKREPDALDFGIWIHQALEDMAVDPAMARCEDAEVLAEFLSARVDDLVFAHFGASPSLPVRYARHSARQRLKAAARTQVDLVREGWEICTREEKHNLALGGITLAGKVDRVDRHRTTGRVRIIDYKSADGGGKPGPEHLGSWREGHAPYTRVMCGGKACRWKDLQLPLYAHMIQAGPLDTSAGMETAYFNLPRAVSHTRVESWEELDGELVQAAIACTEAIVHRIRRRMFWPPSSIAVDRDPFGHLFPGAVEDHVDQEAFLHFCKEGGATW